jgi:small subunit ribosomal protein S20
MANTKSAKKSARQNDKRQERNLARRTAVKTAIKKVITAVEEGAQETQELLLDAIAKIARAQGKGLLHKNTAARKISRLTRRVNATQRAAEPQA